MKLPRPRGYVETAIHVAMPIMFSTIAIWSVVAVCLIDVQFLKLSLPFGVLAGFHAGLILGLIVAVFIRGEKATVEFIDADDFIRRLDAVLARLQYYPSIVRNGLRIYKPSWRGAVAAGPVSVKLFDDCATVVGPRYYVKKLQMKLDRD
jgi:hypothetical protein